MIRLLFSSAFRKIFKVKRVFQICVLIGVFCILGSFILLNENNRCNVNCSYDISTTFAFKIPDAVVIQWKLNESISNTRNVNWRNGSHILETDFFQCINSNETINSTKFKLKPSPCQNGTFLVWLIKSSSQRNSLRSFLRKSWARNDFLNQIHERIIVKRIFLVGSTLKQTKHPMLSAEHRIFDDILQGNFEDTFKSVTSKVIMGMQFVKDHCPSVKYVAVVDDDSVVLSWNLFPALHNSNKSHFYAGFSRSLAGPERVHYKRWYIRESEYSCYWYPTYAEGMCYVMSYKTVVAFYDEAQRSQKYFPFDDVYIGMIANKLRVNITEIDGHFDGCDLYTRSHQAASFEKLIGCHGADTKTSQDQLWQEFCHATTNSKRVAKRILLYCDQMYK